jgi:hypothetical protein
MKNTGQFGVVGHGLNPNVRSNLRSPLYLGGTCHLSIKELIGLSLTGAAFYMIRMDD